MDARIMEADEAFAEASAARTRAIATVQAECEHPTALYVPYKPGTIWDVEPFVVCTNCGLQERRWGALSNQRITTKFLREVSFHEAIQARRIA